MNETETKTRLTGSDLATRGLDALDVTHYDQMPVDNAAKSGEISGVDWMKVMELGKALCAMQDGMPVHVRGRWGIGCRIAANAYQWRMDPFAIADQTYVVNNRLGYMSQLIHALINRNAPLMHRLECHYIGEGQDRQCKVVGYFISGDEREYTTPKLKDIKVKNSPSWAGDPDQQLWYFGVRAWGRKWVPEVMLGVYTKEELESDPEAIRGYDTAAPGLHARLKGSERSEEGHHADNVAAQLDEIENGGEIVEEAPAPERRAGQGKTRAPKEGKDPTPKAKRAGKLPKGKASVEDVVKSTVEVGLKRGQTASKVEYPSTVAEYLAYARRWIKAEPDKVALGQRWAQERRMRNDLGLTSEDREPLEALMQKRLDEK